MENTLGKTMSIEFTNHLFQLKDLSKEEFTLLLEFTKKNFPDYYHKKMEDKLCFITDIDFVFYLNDPKNNIASCCFFDLLIDENKKEKQIRLHYFSVKKELRNQNIGLLTIFLIIRAAIVGDATKISFLVNNNSLEFWKKVSKILNTPIVINYNLAYFDVKN